MGWKNVALIVLGLAAWGGLHAYGAYLFNHSLARALITAAVTGAFLVFWGVLLFSARKKFARYARRAKTAESQHQADPAHKN